MVLLRICLFTALLTLATQPAHAYIGPGAGFAVVSSFLILLASGAVAFATLLIWPFRALMIHMKRRKIDDKRQVGRIVVLGLDGFDPGLAHKFMAAGKMPTFSRMAEDGSFRPLATTTPSISPVAWSSFSTGVNPGKHRIFDFYTRDPRNYLPVLSSSRIASFTKKIGFGPLAIPFKKTGYEFMRKSTSFWTVLGKYGVFSNILRVPITFPPEKFYGACLSAMCAPDLRGTQGAFTLITGTNGQSGEDTALDEALDGVIIPMQNHGKAFTAEIPGPPHGKDGKDLTLTVKGELKPESGQVVMTVGDERFTLKEGEYSDWIKLPFPVRPGKRITGIARFLLTEVAPTPKIYLTPINIDPEKPTVPVSSPFSYCVSLAKLHGSFSTLGLAEDTWALNERHIDEAAFLKQAYDIFEERKAHFYDALKNNDNGLVVSVIDTTDRIQHMFFRYLDEDHPANAGKDSELHKGAVEDLYVRMDDFVSEVQGKLKPNDLLLVISDHGFCQFKWGLNLNTWLMKEGYLVLKDGMAPEDGVWFSNVDWDRTRAYAYGLSGIFMNLKGREKKGVVKKGAEQNALCMEIAAKLEAMYDKANDRKPVRRAILAKNALKGPYLADAPDIFVGFARGYRASWNSAVGRITEDVYEDNTKSWSGDHSVDPLAVPGVFFSNWKLADERPELTDLAPTILHLFGVGKQGYQDGRVLDLQPPAA
jgi:predicted AlkP superfamily phosphohydrolase/phosphomutase